ncbi:helix-turn-helix transcriptional regulator [Amycolatopsis sp. CA-230715]|uniref:helix-turn-helix transcriptional regulator n=1 Tax=Amycolatopsis sp. CA-230715 TaxID=2745196 RepID=UPI001C0267C8|nr:response regulator transcription factor [Amycolatopsis sp. CA-230715]QWF83503.1 DNA-binding transcriptional activator DevR/DosR [Amycolatopsis sp. CA-230715]
MRGSPVLTRPVSPVTVVGVAVCASDPVTEFGVKTLLGADPRVKVLAEDEFALAEVIVVAEAGTARGVLPLLREVRAAARSKPLPRCVVVTDSFRADAVVAAIDCGMAALLPSSRITGDALVRTILAVLNGDGVFPSWLQAQLLDQLETIRRDVLEPRGFTLSGLSVRERDVLRMLSEGHSTEEIATGLNYSESTVKNVVNEVTARHGLRNRAHAVAFALRAGLI